MQTRPRSLKEMAIEDCRQWDVCPDSPASLKEFLGLDAIPLYAKEIKCSVWGKPGELTFSLGKNDVWDRRLFLEKPVKFSTLCEKAFKDGWLNEKNPLYYQSYAAYDFPCPKPVGQLIIKNSCLDSGEIPVAVTHFHNGTTTVTCKNGDRILEFRMANLMTRNLIVYAFKTRHLGDMKLRLYRHLDSSGAYSQEENSEDRTGQAEGYDDQKDFPGNAPIEPPTCGYIGDMAWIRQRFPAEKTFPKGFAYVYAARLVGIDAKPSVYKGYNLGTPAQITNRQYQNAEESETDRYFIHSRCAPRYEPVNNAWGVACDLALTLPDSAHFTLLSTIVTTADATEGEDLLTLAARNLAGPLDAEELFRENQTFYDELYARREKGRTFWLDDACGQTGQQPEPVVMPHFGNRSKRPLSEVEKAFYSWSSDHSGNTAANPSRYQSDNVYAYLNSDYSPWHGDIHFNELTPTPYCVVGQFDRLDLWEKLLNHLLPNARQNARDVYGLDGAFYGLCHVPIKIDGIYHTHEVWENSLELSGQNLLGAWRCFEYTGDKGYVRRIWEPLLAAAVFYAGYVTAGEDGQYHVIPTVSAEHHGLTKDFALNCDSTSALCVIRWNLEAALEGARLLGVDLGEKAGQFSHILQNLADYPTFESGHGPIFVDVRHAEPIDYNLTAPLYPVFITDHIHLDSPRRVLETAIRTAQTIKGWDVPYVRILLAIDKGTSPEHLINSHGGDIHLFPAVATGVQIGFQRLCAKKGFEVSATYQDGCAGDVMVFSRAGSVCRMVFPQPIVQFSVINQTTMEAVPARIDQPAGLKERLVFQTEKNTSYKIVQG